MPALQDSQQGDADRVEHDGRSLHEIEPSQRISRVLVLGDGNFSFSLAVARFLWGEDGARGRTERKNGDRRHTTREDQDQDPDGTLRVDAMDSPYARALMDAGSGKTPAHEYFHLPPRDESLHITTTSFDTYEQVCSKYHDARGIIERLGRYQGLLHVRHEVNAWELEKLELQAPLGLDFIVWNHPHLGTEDFRLHRFLLAHFFKSAFSALKPGGRVLVSLVHGQDARWEITEQAVRSGFVLEHVEPFKEHLFPGYEPKRNRTGASFKNSGTKRHTGQDMNSSVWRFLKPVGTKVVSETVPAGETVEDQKNEDAEQSAVASVSSSKGLTAVPVEPLQARGVEAKGEPFQCSQCGKVLTSARGLKSHIQGVHTLNKYGSNWRPDMERSIACGHPGCDKKFALEEAAWQHRVNKHTSVENTELDGIPDARAAPPTRISAESGYPPADQSEPPFGSVDVGHGADAEPASMTAGDTDGEFTYYPCPTCGQAVVRRTWGMLLHLEQLKPVLGLDMRCPTASCGRTFIEGRALVQHYKFCRVGGWKGSA
ncbi:hypothetical protein M427DRAFT_55147 [Gonapodya prolifera JEL478]|uniref:C2H2-type domain-containing protein n=1 Tax=Gonapodya prolifera (strain JEL478) TaxID=1344416 RepID=A0A139AJ33_GONPJ|nr:hypothetical protein M427DRAFT_55147 [Gonapodya prolifera JEL478]|eukprot:KXS16806.1 hypothetical protein M427DRAFT_55147 [Gonapodya prolifera JEL478]